MDLPFIIETIDGKWVSDRFRSLILEQEPKTVIGEVRKYLGQAKEALSKSNSKNGLTKDQIRVIENEGVTLDQTPNELAVAISKRLEEYGVVQDWLELNKRVELLSRDIPANKDLVNLKMLIGRVSGRALNVELSGFSDQLESLLGLLNSMDENIKYENIHIEFTSDPNLIISRGLLRPELTNCFNAYADPKQISTLTDDLASRNKILVLVKDNTGQVLSVAVLKVKRLEDGTPLLFLERPLSMKGYNFQPMTDLRLFLGFGTASPKTAGNSSGVG